MALFLEQIPGSGKSGSSDKPRLTFFRTHRLPLVSAFVCRDPVPKSIVRRSEETSPAVPDGRRKSQASRRNRRPRRPRALRPPPAWPLHPLSVSSAPGRGRRPRYGPEGFSPRLAVLPLLSHHWFHSLAIGPQFPGLSDSFSFLFDDLTSEASLQTQRFREILQISFALSRSSRVFCEVYLRSPLGRLLSSGPRGSSLFGAVSFPSLFLVSRAKAFHRARLLAP